MSHKLLVTHISLFSYNFFHLFKKQCLYYFTILSCIGKTLNVKYIVFLWTNAKIRNKYLDRSTII